MIEKVAILGFSNPFVNKSDGGKVEIFNRIKALNLLKCDISFYSIIKKDERTSYKNGVMINKLYAYPVNNKITYLFNKMPLSVNNRYLDILVEKMKKVKFDLTIYENSNMVKYKIDKNIESKLHYLRIHNMESVFRIDTFKSSFPRLSCWLQLIEACKYKYIEKNFFGQFDRLLFISKDEKDYFEKRYPKLKGKCIWMPPVIECVDKFDYSKVKANSILFYGDLTVSHNFEGIKWFISTILGKITEKIPNVELNIIGKVKEKDKIKLTKNYNVNVLGYVDDLNSYIDSSTIVIAPILHGGGVKIKVLSALSRNKILVATDKAIEGTDFMHNQHLIVSNNPDEYAEYCIDILKHSDKYHYLGINALEHIRAKYSIRNQAEILSTLYECDIKHKK